jgi:hypothetical protein
MVEVRTKEPTKLDRNTNQLRSDRFVHGVNFSEPIVRPESGCTIDPYDFTDENMGISNGCEFVLDPEKKGHTAVVRLIKPEAQVNEIPSSGSGFFLVEDADVKVYMYHFSDEDLQRGTYEFSLNMQNTRASVWIADPNSDVPFRVINLTNPPFDGNTEIAVNEDDSSVSSKFWEQYHALINMGKLTPLPE